MKSGLVVAALASLALLTSCAPATAPHAALPHYETAPCAADFAGLDVTVDCGVLHVEETRGAGDGRIVALPVAIVRARAAQKQPDPVVFLPGGPGGGVIAALPRILKTAFGRELIATDRDWIFFEPRGTGLSAPLLDCGPLDLTDAGLASDAAVAAAQACLARHAAVGVTLGSYNSETLSRDVADLRDLLKISSYNLYGVSYGSRLAFTVERYDPEGLRAVIHDSPYPPEAKGTQTLPKLVSREVREVLALCAADPACNRRFPNLAVRLDAFAAELLSAPKTIGSQTYRAEDLGMFLLDALYSSTGARRLPLDVAAFLEGKMGALDGYIAGRSTYDEAMNLAFFCKEELPFEDPQAMAASAEGDPIAQTVAPVARRYFEACQGADFGAPLPSEIEPVTTATPTLLIAAGIDAGCPTELSEAAVKTLENGQVVEFPNMTHGLARQSACARGMIAAFLADPKAPVDQACVARDHARFEFTLQAR